MRTHALLVLALAAAVAAAAGAQVMYARTSAPVRSARTLGAATLGRLSQGEAVQVSGKDGRYFRVLYKGKAGYVYFNKLAEEQLEDVATLLGGLAGPIQLSELEAGGALRGLSPMAADYAEQTLAPDWAVAALEAMQGRAVSAADLEAFQREGDLGEYGEGGGQ